MKLAIVVTYIVNPAHGRLLELHLDRLERHTDVPWTIYGSVNRLLPVFRELLERRDGVRLFEFPATDLRGTAEHAHYLEQLIAHAVGDGATHVALLHVDSFPIADGWARAMAGRISDQIAFVTAEHITTACLLFPRSFYLEHRPTLLRPDAADDEEWSAYVREVKPVQHSGIGYGFAAWRAGKRWYALPETIERPEQVGLRVFGDAIVHVEGALRLADYVGQATPALRRLGARRAGFVADNARRMLQAVQRRTPAVLRRAIRKVVPVTVDDRLFDPQRKIQAAGMSESLERLLADPDGYLRSLPRR